MPRKKGRGKPRIVAGHACPACKKPLPQLVWADGTPCRKYVGSKNGICMHCGEFLVTTMKDGAFSRPRKMWEDEIRQLPFKKYGFMMRQQKRIKEGRQFSRPVVTQVNKRPPDGSMIQPPLGVVKQLLDAACVAYSQLAFHPSRYRNRKSMMVVLRPLGDAIDRMTDVTAGNWDDHRVIRTD